jgi:hypothetical protein
MTAIEQRQKRIEWFTASFAQFLDAFERYCPFTRHGQLEFHVDTIRLRRELGSASAAIRDITFLKNLYETLRAWGIGSRGSHLRKFVDFADALIAKEKEIAQLDGLSIEKADLNIEALTSLVWNLIDSLEIVENEARLVACSKTLHHILPDLVVPIDRGYTQKLFGWENPQFQYGQERCFEEIFEFFVSVARAANPAQYVGAKWNTSATKVIDNAVVGAVCLMKHQSAEPVKAKITSLIL